MSDYNKDSYSYNHIIRGYEHTWPGKKEPVRRDSDTTCWVLLSIASLLGSLFAFVGMF